MPSPSDALRACAVLTCVLSTPLAAQARTIVSPIGTATSEGNTSNAFPWNDTAVSPVRTYMQIHSDLGVAAAVISNIAWRGNGGIGSTTSTRSQDLELYMGWSVSFDRASFVYANNYAGQRTNVFPRQVINWGPLSGSGPTAPFNYGIPLTTPFVYVGAFSLCWEAVLHSASGSFLTPDAHGASQTSAPVSTTGGGCTVSGQVSPMILVPSAADMGGTIAFGTYVDRAPPNVPVFLAIGSVNPSLPVPGLCGALYTNLLVTLPIGSSNGVGFLGSYYGTTKYAGGPACFGFPNTAPGATIYVQAHAPDVGSTLPIPVVNSDGKQLTLPFPNLTAVVAVTRLFNDSNSVTDPWSMFFNTSTIGYGLVTEFTY